ncbi:MAG: FRG domain-containing protein [Candidatus Doudnabacteria bacterium]
MESYKKLHIDDFNNFRKENKTYNDGVLELQLTSWGEFHDVVRIFGSSKDYIWRGQNKIAKLESSFDRKFTQRIDRQKELNKIFNNLKQRLEDLQKTGPLTDNEIWAIGQHYGLLTPLLDWTESPYIASYFAFYERGNGQENRVVYALNRALKLLMKGADRFVDFDLFNNNFDHRQNQRLRNQKGKFTKALEGEDIKSVVEKFWKETRKKNKYLNEIIFAEIRIPDKFQDECLRSLESMNITHGVLFPDYAGAVDICKIDLVNNKIISPRAI